ncbi:hypothetical protein [Parasulfitobacter algicola]|uniref:Uncharacterized protein n=1 Tax=Parasulfitobacter algicola TaxID=2614809 RepID=A0ABX2ITM4_9RHOB|nr:hypothetical protein [Sulfitobacter algicola]NSX55905.1 hypothetical protein [Sulfitobacter algicola]
MKRSKFLADITKIKKAYQVGINDLMQLSSSKQIGGPKTKFSFLLPYSIMIDRKNERADDKAIIYKFDELRDSVQVATNYVYSSLYMAKDQIVDFMAETHNLYGDKTGAFLSELMYSLHSHQAEKGSEYQQADILAYEAENQLTGILNFPAYSAVQIVNYFSTKS